MTITIDLDALTANADGSADTRYPNGDKPLTVKTITGSGFGTNSSIGFFQNGGDIYLNGVVDTAEDGQSTPDTTTIWGSINTNVAISTSGQRYTGEGQHYEAEGNGSLIGPQSNVALGASDDIVYTAFWGKVSSDLFRTYVFKYTGTITGTFNTNSDYTKVNTSTIDLLVGDNDQCYVLGVDTVNKYITVEYVGSSPGSTALDGATVTDDISGASVVLNTLASSGYSLLAATKMSRIIDSNGYDGSNRYMATAHSHNSVLRGILDIDYYDDSNVQQPPSTTNDIQTESLSTNPDQWGFVELLYDFSGAGDTGYATARYNNGTKYTVSSQPTQWRKPTEALRLDNIGLDLPGIGSIPYSSVKVKQQYGDIYIDNSPKRVVIGNNAVYDSCTIIEPQRHTSWADTEIIFDVNLKSLAGESGLYVHILDGFTTIYSEAL